MEPATISPIRTTITAAPNAATYFSRRDISHHNRTTHADVRPRTVAKANRDSHRISGALCRIFGDCTRFAPRSMLPRSSHHHAHRRLVLALGVRHLFVVCAAPPRSRAYQIGTLRERPGAP